MASFLNKNSLSNLVICLVFSVFEMAHCVSLQFLALFFGTIDFISGLTSFVVMICRLKEPIYVRLTIEFVKEHIISLATFPALTDMPLEFLIPSLVCYAIECCMGIPLIIGAYNKKLQSTAFVCCWIVITLATSPFTGALLRIFEFFTMCCCAPLESDDGEISDWTLQHPQGQHHIETISASIPIFHRNSEAAFHDPPPSYREIFNNERSVPHEEYPPSYDETMTIAIKWIYGKRWIMNTPSVGGKERLKKFMV